LSDEAGKSTPLGRSPPRAILFGCAGERLSAAERSLFADSDPLGFVLFRRNCREPGQVRTLVAELRDCVGRADAPVLIDQEGGRVARLQPPHWRTYPAAAALASLPDRAAEEAVRLGARLIADDLASLGVTVDAAPVLDLPVAGADGVIGDRAYGSGPARVARLGRAMCRGLLEGGVLPVVKHMPGHGRAVVDSHHDCPVVDAGADELTVTDFEPFHRLADMPWAMTAHVVYSVFDREPATMSRRLIDRVIRRQIGFDGVLVSDDIGMGALSGRLAERVENALHAGCDLVLHCSGVLDEMADIAETARSISAETAARLTRGETMRLAARRDFDRGAAEARFDALIGGPQGEDGR
jgi:beta-N-acetylhexosaminidase